MNLRKNSKSNCVETEYLEQRVLNRFYVHKRQKLVEQLHN